ncbi:electroneutral sodium bicarbonate exchanger 1-like isoform X1 [Tigriopus californicus]|uniref:electroneutral sodium bicarbonate exchanger 1-like isoform X1 n=1 Tax=Tigriopus californicus TaxID=6832 RepID=UPI0027DA9C5D|nr:electroneutral sodium bicarbonate exchanger 1-like isoform X1 [Tigriopus californicus]
MEELITNEKGEREWRETARWVKFEENVEIGGNRWSKPHVGTISLKALLHLRNILTSCPIQMDLEASNLAEVTSMLVANLARKGHLRPELQVIVKEAIMKRHQHQHQQHHSGQPRLPLIRSIAEIGRRQSTIQATSDLGLGGASETSSAVSSTNNSSRGENDPSQVNTHFMKKVPKDSEGNSILIGDVCELDHPIACFIRLANAVYIGDLTEVAVPTRFIFLLLTPKSEDLPDVREIGRCMATIMSDDVFHDVAYKAQTRRDFQAGIDEFLDQVTGIPPNEWDPSIRIEPPAIVPSQDARKKPMAIKDKSPDTLEDEERQQFHDQKEAGLVYTTTLFKGLCNDVRRKIPFYLSDFRDGFNAKTAASVVFMFFAVLAPSIILGGILGESTNNRIGVIETLLGNAIVGIVYGLFSGQPLSILGLTGPVLIYEKILFTMTVSLEWEYLNFRLCVGIWIAIFLFSAVACNLSSFVTYISRFTEETFAALIGVLFIWGAIKKLLSINNSYPLDAPKCACSPRNGTSVHFDCNFLYNDGMVEQVTLPEACEDPTNVYLMSVILFTATFLIIIALKRFRSSGFGPTWIRGYLSDFAVIIALIAMTWFDFGMGVDTPKLKVPASVEPTWTGRSWIISPFGPNPWWSSFVAIGPAVLGSILIFMDQQITVVIVNRKENLLKKGCGYHLDLFCVSVMVLVCSIFGFPWCEASTVPAINHVKSLSQESKSSAPGEKPRFLGIMEQRVTHLVVFILIGLSVFIAPALAYVPMPVLFGVFLFMGVAALDGLQFVNRILIVLKPKKHQPDTPYLRHVPTNRVHGFTGVQVLCLLVLACVNELPYNMGVVFPIMLVLLVFVRQFILPRFFDLEDLKMLDSVWPSFQRCRELDKEERLKRQCAKALNLVVSNSGNLKVPMANGCVMSIPLSAVQEETSKVVTESQSIETDKDGDSKPRTRRNILRRLRGTPKLSQSVPKDIVIVREDQNEEPHTPTSPAASEQGYIFFTPGLQV